MNDTSPDIAAIIQKRMMALVSVSKANLCLFCQDMTPDPNGMLAL